MHGPKLWEKYRLIANFKYGASEALSVSVFESIIFFTVLKCLNR